MTTNIKDFFYSTPMQEAVYEYAQLLLDLIPEEIIEQYELRKIVINNKVYFEIRKGILGLQKVSIIANERSFKLLTLADYIQSRFTLSL